MLWKMDFMVEGKDLEKCLAGVEGLALNMQVPRPVTNAILQGKQVKQVSMNTNQVSRLEEALKEQGFKRDDILRSTKIRELMDALEIPKGNYSSLITTMKKHEFLTTTENRGVLKML